MPLFYTSGRTSLGPLIRDEIPNGNVTDGDDELLECLVKTATKFPATRIIPRERKRTRHTDRKSCKWNLRTLHSASSVHTFLPSVCSVILMICNRIQFDGDEMNMINFILKSRPFAESSNQVVHVCVHFHQVIIQIKLSFTTWRALKKYIWNL